MSDTTDALFALQLRLLLDLLKENDVTTARLLRLYSGVYEKLSAQWLDVLAQIEKRRGTDGLPTQSFDLLLFQQARIRALRQQTAAQVGRFAREAEKLVTAEQRQAVDVGKIHAQRLMAESLKMTAPGLEVTWSQLPTGALRELVGRFNNGEPLRNLFDALGPDAAAKAEGVLFNAVATGTGPVIAARQLRTEIGVPLTRAMAISRTEMISAYRRANLDTFRANDDVVKAWRWNAKLDGRVCASCAALHGTVHSLDEPFHEHVVGRCVPSPVTVRWSDLGHRNIGDVEPPQTGVDWFDEQSDAVKLRLLGPGKLALLKSGRIDLEDLVYESNSPRWGPSFREGSIANALAAHGQPKAWQRYSAD